MIRRSFDADGDYAINSFIEDSAATVQAVTTRLRMFRGEWFLNLQEGVPWFQSVFVKPARQAVADKLIRDTINQTDGVESIISYDSNYNSSTRRLSVTFTARTIYGEEFEVIGLNPLGA